MKMILVFVNGELYKTISYRTKTLAKKNLAIFKKLGILNPLTGEHIADATFELI